MKTFAQILSGLELDTDKKIETKIPSWKGLPVPSSLSLEQCSSEAAAAYKASLLVRRGIGSVADLTGGLGVDSAAFSRVAQSVLYVERDAVLARAAESNFKALGIDNITVRCAETGPELVRDLPPFDCIYLDPARRSSSGKKVFLPEDCSPDVTVLLPLLLEKAGLVVLKLSPMADITMLRRRFGAALREIHVVGLGGECKELLCLLSACGEGFKLVVGDAEYADRAVEIPAAYSPAAIPFAEAVPSPGRILCVPTAIAVKAGCQAFFCGRFSLEALSRGTGICLLSDGAALPDPLYYKSYELECVRAFSREGLRQVGQLCPRCEVTARGVRMSSEELAARLKVGPGGDRHVFGTLCGGEKLLFVTRRM